MSVLFETSLGDLIVDLETELCPKTSENFLKLCKIYYYNFCSFFNVQREFIAQTGDPTETGTGGESIFPTANKLFTPEIRMPKLRHTARGTLSMAVANGLCGSQFFFTLADNIDYLDGKHAPFGRLVGEESFETLEKINQALVDEAYRPLRDIRIRHVIVLDDPFEDPPGLVVPPESPVPTPAQLKSLRIGDEEDLSDPEENSEAKEQRKRDREARAQALTLEMVGDLPFAEVRPPENVLFVCKLNRVTRSEDLELIFSRFGTILSCEVIRDKKTGDSLNYAFIEFDKQEEAERAYSKMDGVLIDDRRIMVDFSQSVSQLHGDWVYQRTGKRAPPGKGGPPRSDSKRSRSPVAPRNPDMVFDLASKYDREQRRGGGGSRHKRHDSGRDRSRSPRRDRYRDDRGGGDSRRRDDGRRDDRDRYRDRERDRRR